MIPAFCMIGWSYNAYMLYGGLTLYAIGELLVMILAFCMIGWSYNAYNATCYMAAPHTAWLCVF